MSIERDVMQFLLDILTDGIVKSGTNQQIGRTPIDKITETQLPFVQVFAPVTDLSEDAAQQPGTVTFVVEIVDVRGQKEAMRVVMEALDSTLRIDMSFKSLVKKGLVAARAVAEVGDDKRTLGSATIVCELYDRIGLSGPFTQILDTDVLGVVIEGQRQFSKIITGGIGVRRAIADPFADIQYRSPTVDDPTDLSEVQRIRALTYTTPEYGRAGILKPALLISTDVNFVNAAVYGAVSENNRTGIGWRQDIYNLQEPPRSVLGAGVGDRSTITHISLAWTMFPDAVTFTSIRFGLVWVACGYHQRDTGLNVNAGYHSDLVIAE